MGGPADYETDHPPRAEFLAQGVVKVWSEIADYAHQARRRVVGALDVEPWLQAHAELFKRLLAGDGE